ncbi:MAG TPA: exodeoxyribonuclease III [Xanthomonadaceae bacterium]|nr:exodeoxyribonuclease III [Xanthomonadaceae bacterium]
MRIITFNANGLRSAASKGFFDWFAGQRADVLCVQETKAQEHQLGDGVYRPPGYRVYFNDAVTRRGYSGVALYCRRKPDTVLDTLGWAPFDQEGRYLEARFGELSVVSLYLPSGSSGEQRQQFKFEALERLRPLFRKWLASGRQYVLCADWNIVHTRNDIRNWSSNQKNSGCLPAERAWIEALLCQDRWCDSFRALRPEATDEYTWWSNRGQARAKNVGWRIDYQLVTPQLGERVMDCSIYREARFSDHAPFTVDYRWPQRGRPGRGR